MRRISTLATVLITSFVMALGGLVASPIAAASENETARVSSRFAFGSPLLTNTHKSAIEKAVTTFGTDATFMVTAEAGKLPGKSDSEVQLLATKRGQVFKSYLVKLGVNKSSVTIKVKITRLGIVPKTKIAGSYATPVLTAANSAGTGSGSSSGGGTLATKISVAAIAGVTAPVTGATPVTTTTAGTGYTGTVSWSASPATFFATFASATIYTATITLTPTSGYTLVGVTANFFTVAGATPVTNSANAGVITAVFPATATTISSAAIKGLTAPVTGATPVTTITPDAQYTGSVTWSPNHATFASATTYTATITLTPTSGYTLIGVGTNYFRDFNLSGATSVTNSANSGVVTAVFVVIVPV